MASKMNKKELYEAYKKLKGEYMKELVCQGAPKDYQEKLEQLEYTNQILEEDKSELREQVTDLNECISMMKDEQDENIQLKKENEVLKKTMILNMKAGLDNLTEIGERYKKLKKENEEQEKDISNLENIREENCDRIIRIEKENEKLHETIKKYEERYGGLIL